MAARALHHVLGIRRYNAPVNEELISAAAIELRANLRHFGAVQSKLSQKNESTGKSQQWKHAVNQSHTRDGGR
jgi:hypothetical protein